MLNQGRRQKSHWTISKLRPENNEYIQIGDR
jgi:hypothetical protein